MTAEPVIRARDGDQQRCRVRQQLRPLHLGFGRLARLSPRCQRESLASAGMPSGDGHYDFVRTALNRKGATAPLASSGAFELVSHWPLGPDLYFDPYSHGIHCGGSLKIGEVKREAGAGGTRCPESWRGT